MTHCLRYESTGAGVSQGGLEGAAQRTGVPSMVGSYSSTKWLWISWMVKQDLPTPPPPTTTSLYSRRNWDRNQPLGTLAGEKGSSGRTLEAMVCCEDGGARWVVRTPGACFAKGRRLGGGER